MAGADEPYDYLPYFYSDLFELGYEAVGDADSRLEMTAEWAEPNRKGVVCYVEEGRPRGFLLWDVWDKVDAARELGLLHAPEQDVILIEQLDEFDPSRVVVISTGSQGEPLSALSLMAAREHKWVKLREGDTRHAHDRAEDRLARRIAAIHASRAATYCASASSRL